MKPLSFCAGLIAMLAACGLGVQSPDLFLVTRTGAGRTLTLLVSDGGAVRCNGGPSKPLADKLLLQARDLANRLNDDAKRGLHMRGGPQSVAMYTVRLQHGTISFPDTAGRTHSELAQLELLTVQVSQNECAVGG